MRGVVLDFLKLDFSRTAHLVVDSFSASEFSDIMALYKCVFT